MKLHHSFALLLLAATTVSAQTNTFPSGIVYTSADGVPWWITGQGNGPAILLQKHSAAGGLAARRGSLGWMDNNGVKSELLTWTQDYGGLVGIGTGNPGCTLEVAKTSQNIIAAFHDTGLGGIGGTGIALLNDYSHPSSRNWALAQGRISYGDLALMQSNELGGNPVTGGTERVYFAASGNVGIGTTSPAAKLSVYGVFDGTLTGAEATYPGTIQIISNGQTGGGPDREGGLEFKTTTSGLGYGHKIIATDLGNGETPLYFERRSNSSAWTTAMTILGSNGNVGIGTTSPSGKLTVTGVGEDVRSVTIDSAEIKFRGDGIAHMSILGPTTNKPYLSIGQTSGNFAPGYPSTEAFVVTASSNVGIGTTSPSEKLSVKGKIRAQEVIVETTGWSDHVFADSYQLQSLAEVEQHIKTEKHLPGVPSAQEVADKGVSLGDMQAILLAKIEELTLRQIAQEKEISRLRESETALRTEVQQLQQLK